MRLSNTIRFTLIGSLLYGCATPPPPDTGAFQRQVLQQTIRTAETLSAEGRPAEALKHWEIAAALAPKDPRIDNSIRQLEKRLDANALKYRRQGLRQLEQGNRSGARRSFILALNQRPDDQESLAQLRKLERRVLSRQLAAKVKKSKTRLERIRQKNGKQPIPEYVATNGATTGKHHHQAATPKNGKTPAVQIAKSASPPAAVRAPAAPAETPFQAHLRKADAAFKSARYDGALHELNQAGQLAAANPNWASAVKAIRGKYASQLYGRGVRAARSDPAEASHLWRQALQFNPDHQKAALRLERGKTSR